MTTAAHYQVKQHLKALFEAEEARKAARSAWPPPPEKTKAPAVAAAQGLQEGTQEQVEFCPDDFMVATCSDAPTKHGRKCSASSAADKVQKQRARVVAGRCICFDIDKPMPKIDYQVLDSIWFRVNLLRHLRMRRALAGEFELDERGQHQWVIVRQLSPGNRMRLPFALHGDESLLTGLPDADAVCDLLLRELSKLPDGGEALLIDILRRAPFDRAPAFDIGEI